MRRAGVAGDDAGGGSDCRRPGLDELQQEVEVVLVLILPMEDASTSTEDRCNKHYAPVGPVSKQSEVQNLPPRDTVSPGRTVITVRSPLPSKVTLGPAQDPLTGVTANARRSLMPKPIPTKRRFARAVLANLDSS
jgi:hypothetical protein